MKIKFSGEAIPPSQLIIIKSFGTCVSCCAKAIVLLSVVAVNSHKFALLYSVRYVGVAATPTEAVLIILNHLINLIVAPNLRFICHNIAVLWACMLVINV